MANYTATTWIDDTPPGTGTPLNAANMNKLESGASAALPQRSVFGAGVGAYANNLVGTDTQPAFAIMGDGRLWWGPGGSTAQDTSLYRSAAATLALTGSFSVGGSFSTVGATIFGGTLYINDSLSIDANTPYLYKYGAKALASNATLRLGGGLFVDLDGAGNKIYFGSAADTNLYRSAGTVLKTDGYFAAGLAFKAGVSGDRTDQYGGITFGASEDTRLYRSGAGVLKTDGQFVVASTVGGIYINHNTNPTLYFGAASDTTLYRFGAGSLATDSNFTAHPGAAYQMAFFNSGGNAAIGFGSAIDTVLFRFAAAELITSDGIFGVGNTSRSMLKIGGGLNHGTFGYTNGDRGIWFADSGRFAPSPPSGGYLYSAGGNLHWISYAGKDTTIATNV